MAEITRTEVLALLQRLDSPDDSEIVAAGRELSRRIAEAGLIWDELLVREGGGALAAEEEAGSAGDDEVVDDDRDEELVTGDLSADLATVERLLKGQKLSADTRDDLLALKADIQRGEFTAMDRRYLQELSRRLEGRAPR